MSRKIIVKSVNLLLTDPKLLIAFLSVASSFRKNEAYPKANRLKSRLASER